MNREVTLPLIVDDRGTLQVAASDVSKLLRTVGGRWLRLVEAGEVSLDEDTVAALTIELAKLADRDRRGVHRPQQRPVLLTRPPRPAPRRPRLPAPRDGVARREIAAPLSDRG